MAWIRRVVEIRTLSGKRDQLKMPLGREAVARLDHLERFFAGNVDNAPMALDRRGEWRASVSLSVVFHTDGGEQVGTLRDISSQGMFVATGAPLSHGTRTEVRVSDSSTGEEWRFSATVARINGDGMGLMLHGIPIAMRLGHRPSQPRVAKAA